jgi:hypothetical protein
MAEPTDGRPATCSIVGYSGTISFDLARERCLFFPEVILAASCAAFRMVIHSEADGFKPRFWITPELPT